MGLTDTGCGEELGTVEDNCTVVAMGTRGVGRGRAAAGGRRGPQRGLNLPPLPPTRGLCSILQGRKERTYTHTYVRTYLS